MNIKSSTTCLLLCWFGFGLADASAVTPAEVKKLIGQGEKITLVDVRANALYKSAHIPGAINIPSSLLGMKEMPAVGHVVVYDDGLGKSTQARDAAEALNKQQGISAEVLEGGFAGWETVDSATTKARGLHEEDMPSISYDQLKKMDPKGAILVDLRHNRPSAKNSAANNPGVEIEPLTDLATEFPGMSVTRNAFTATKTSRTSSTTQSSVSDLLILIDADDISARETARALRANGQRRFVILAGGESILARHGQKGLQRSSSTLSFKKPVSPANTNTNR